MLCFNFQTLSSWATSSVEEVASTGPGIRFFQLYVSLTDMFDVLYRLTKLTDLHFRHQKITVWLYLINNSCCLYRVGVQGQECSCSACEES